MTMHPLLFPLRFRAGFFAGLLPALALALASPSSGHAAQETVLIDDDFGAAAARVHAAPGDGPLGWKVEGSRAWAVGVTRNSPRVLAAEQHDGRPIPEGIVSKGFSVPEGHERLVLTATAGVLWGRANSGNGYAIDLLDGQGNGYRILFKRADAAWAGQWTRVAAGQADKGQWHSEKLTGTQPDLVGGAPLVTLTVTAEGQGRFTVASSLWGGAALRFRDTATTRFTQVRLVADGGTNDRAAFGRVRLVSSPAGAATAAAGGADIYQDFNHGAQKKADVEGWVQAIRLSEPVPRSDVRGDVRVRFTAAGMTEATAWSWRQPTPEKPGPWGHDVELTPGGIPLDAQGNGAFVFPAETFPHGPVTVRIAARGPEGRRDVFELQLFNLGGVKWAQGIPDRDPPGAAGLKLVFADDFDGPLSISNDGRGARYNAHKPRFGDFSGWAFSDVLGDGKPFSQVGTWLRISARKDELSPKGRSGLIASVDMDGKGFWTQAPAYLECRFVAQAAPGTWPAFWTISHLDRDIPGDEIDIIEAYGGLGKGNPNHPGYSITNHAWNQRNPDGTRVKAHHTVVPMTELGGGSYWSHTAHTYGVRVGKEETVFYLNDIEVFRHPTHKITRTEPFIFLINYAIGGISRWPIDLERYGNGTDMYVDYVRVYAEGPLDYVQPPVSK